MVSRVSPAVVLRVNPELVEEIDESNLAKSAAFTKPLHGQNRIEKRISRNYGGLD